MKRPAGVGAPGLFRHSSGRLEARSLARQTADVTAVDAEIVQLAGRKTLQLANGVPITPPAAKTAVEVRWYCATWSSSFFAHPLRAPALRAVLRRRYRWRARIVHCSKRMAAMPKCAKVLNISVTLLCPRRFCFGRYAADRWERERQSQPCLRKLPIERDAGGDHEAEDDEIAVGPAQLGHVLEIHAVDAGDRGRHGEDGGPGGEPAGDVRSAAPGRSSGSPRRRRPAPRAANRSPPARGGHGR